MRIFFFLIAGIIFTSACAQLPAPQRLAWVHDYAAVLDSLQEDSLTKFSQQIEDSTGSQVVLLTITSLEGKTIEDVGLQTVRTWGIGRAGYNDGILILFAITDRKVRIEVGYGLENVVKDELAARIIEHDMVPFLREGNYFEAFRIAQLRIGALIKANPVVERMD